MHFHYHEDTDNFSLALRVLVVLHDVGVHQQHICALSGLKAHKTYYNTPDRSRTSSALVRSYYLDFMRLSFLNQMNGYPVVLQHLMHLFEPDGTGIMIYW